MFTNFQGKENLNTFTKSKKSVQIQLYKNRSLLDQSSLVTSLSVMEALLKEIEGYHLLDHQKLKART